MQCVDLLVKSLCLVKPLVDLSEYELKVSVRNIPYAHVQIVFCHWMIVFGAREKNGVKHGDGLSLLNNECVIA